MKTPDSGVSVRMYNTGFGDCFLLCFRKRDGKPFYMLIDCGVHGQYKGGSERIRKIVAHIKEETNKRIDVVVVTHEHADHISGFYSAKDDFQSMAIDRAWLGWTEDPDNKVAQEIEKKKALMLRGLQAARSAFAADGQSSAADGLQEVLGFYDYALDGGLGISSRKSRDLIVEYSKKKPYYLKPKRTPLTLPGVDDVRIFVLGPPTDTKLLLKAKPSKKKGQVYQDDDHGLHLGAQGSLAAALAASGDWASQRPGETESAQPFAGNHRLRRDQVRTNKKLYQWFHERYGFKRTDPEEWRRIDSDWKDGAESLALKLDSATNNTSLVLAIELMKTGRILLFAGDAQVGNWLSWHEGDWTQDSGLDSGETITAEDLLRRTILYKVGHHGSHNATLRDKGLAMMTSKDLTAMVPVDETWAKGRKPHPWKMPFDPLYADLVTRTKGRILRTDEGLVKPSNEMAAWRHFEKQVTVKKESGRIPKILYAQLDIPDP